MRCFRLQVSRRRAQGFNGCLARIVQRSHPDCRKPVRWTLKVGSALQCGARCRRATVSPLRIHGQGPRLALGPPSPAIRKMSVNGMEIVTQWDLDRSVRDGKGREALLASIVERSRPPAARCRIGRQTSGEEAAIQVRSRETKKRHRGSQLCRRRYNGLSVRSRRRCSLPSHR